MHYCLKAIRKKRGMTQAEVCRLAHITQPFLSNVESGRRCPSVETAKILGQVLGFDWTLLYAKAETASGEGGDHHAQ